MKSFTRAVYSKHGLLQQAGHRLRFTTRQTGSSVITRSQGRYKMDLGVSFQHFVVRIREADVSDGENHHKVLADRDIFLGHKAVKFYFPSKSTKNLDIIRRRMLTDKLLKTLTTSSDEDVFPGFRFDYEEAIGVEIPRELKPRESNVAKSLSTFIKGIAVLQPNSRNIESQIEKEFKTAECPIDTCMYDVESNIFSQICNNTTILRPARQKVAKPECIIEKPHLHPIFEDERNVPVFHSFEQALSILQRSKDLEPVNELLSRIPRLLNRNNMEDTAKDGRFPFIVVEGLDGSGKSTMVQNLARFLNADQLVTPPACISDLRKAFDSYPEMVRRAFYITGNYIVEQQVIERIQKKPVVTDRFWHSTTAYALANGCNCGTGEYLPPRTDPVLAWPKTLLQPSAILFTFVPENERRGRVHSREKEVTEEEKVLDKSSQFRKRLIEAYKRISCNLWLEVDTSGTPEESLQKATDLLVKHGIISGGSAPECEMK